MVETDRRDDLRIATILTIIISFLFLALRMISRIFITRQTTWDDYLMVFAWFIALGGAITMILGARQGLGLMDVDIKPQWISPLKKYGYAYSVLYNPALMATKSSILIFYLHLSKTKKGFRCGIYGTLAVVNVVGLILTLITVFQCRPISQTFSPERTDITQNCIPVVTLFLASSPANVFTGIAILVLPIPVLTGMRLPLRQRLILVLTFGLGIFVTIVDVVRIFYLQQALSVVSPSSTEPQVTHGFGAGPDFVFHVARGLMWSVVEINVGIICGCVPLMKPLMVKVIPWLINPSSIDTVHRASQVSATLTRPEQMPSQRPTVVQSNIEGFTPLNFRMPTFTLQEISMEDLQGLGTPILSNKRQTPVPSTSTLGTPIQTPSRSTLSQVQQASSQSPSRQPSNSSVLENDTSIGQTSQSASSSVVHESDCPAQRRSRYIAPPQRQIVDNPIQQPEQAIQAPTLSLQQQRRQEMEMPDFLTTPGTRNTLEGRGSALQQATSVYFGFVNIREPKSMLQTSTKDSWKYCAYVSLLFFLLGFMYGLLNTLNVQISLVANYTQALTLSLHTVYFGGYLFGPLTVGLFCLKRGFKATLIVGLCILGTGTLIFWPSSILIAYPGFIVSNFIIGFGLSVIETAGNPFVILCGPPRYGEVRLLVVQFVQSIGSIVSALIVDKAFFPPTTLHNNVLSIRWTYLAISFITVILSLFIYYMPFPEASDEDLRNSTKTQLLPLNGSVSSQGDRICGLRVPILSLAFACVAMFSYMFSQETFNVWFNNTLISVAGGGPGRRRKLQTPNFVLVGHAMFAVSCLVSAVLCLKVRPRLILLGALIGAAAIRLTFTLMPAELAKRNTTKVAGLAVTEYFMEGPIYAIIFGLALRGLGAKTKLGSALVTTMNIGGAVGPWAVLGIINSMGNNRRPFIIGVVLLFLVSGYPLYLSVVRRAREIVDWHHNDDDELQRRTRIPALMPEMESSNGIIRRNGTEHHWAVLAKKEWRTLRRASATSGKAVGNWVVGVREWTRRVSGLGKEAVAREFA